MLDNFDCDMINFKNFLIKYLEIFRKIFKNLRNYF